METEKEKTNFLTSGGIFYLVGIATEITALWKGEPNSFMQIFFIILGFLIVVFGLVMLNHFWVKEDD